MYFYHNHFYSLDFGEFAVEERFVFANLNDGYDQIIVVSLAEHRRWIYPVSRVHF